MAASVGKRQFGHLEKARAHSHYTPPIPTFATTTHYSSDEEEEEKQDPDWWKPLCNAALEIEPLVRDEATADNWIPRSPALIHLTGKHPFNSEPALSRLMHHGFITPTPIHYVRNHGSVPRADWSTWTIDITGLVRRPLRLNMDQLVGEFPSADIPVTLVCAGNRRKEQNMVRQTAGFNWGPSAISTSVWRGVRLRDILKRCGIMGSQHGALNVCFEGAEDLPGGGGSKYGTSLRRQVAMDPSRDVLIAYMQNGELLLPDHGFPVRVIIPGFIGGRMVKWLKKITVTTQESDNYYHYKDNRVLPSHVDAELANSEAWWYKPEYIINELNVNSVITSPGHDEILPINSATEQREYTVKGYAYSGGGKKITRVEITLDSGETWQVCSLDCPEKPNKYGKYWCWCFWSLEVEVFEILSAKEIAVRAWDETLNTQPEKLIWNLMGMMNNCWFKVKANICRPRRGELGVVFEHPTQPGGQSGGWMARKKTSEPTLKKSLSSPFMNTATKQYSISELRRHSTPDSAWIVVHGYVYDCTVFLKDHPGGADSILINAGTDCTEEFDAIHSDRAKIMLDKYRIGELITTGHGYTSDGSLHGASNLTTISEAAPTIATALSNPREKVQVQLVSKKIVSSDARLFRFALPSANLLLGLPVGKHIFLYAHIDGKLCVRAYTPTSPADTVGYLELLVKIYFSDVNPKFPKGGLMSQYLESLPIGATLDVKGPVGHIEYTGRGNFVIHGVPRFARRLAMVAAGTGITPVYQVIHAVMRDQPGDETEMWLVYACRTKEDILLKEELDGWAREYPGRLKVLYLVGASRRPEEWAKVLSENVPMGGDSETLALVCGPPAMVEFVVVPNLVKMNYEAAKSVLVF